MKGGKASRTADIAVIFRANHSIVSESERIFYDPYAKGFLEGIYKVLHALCGSRFIFHLLGMYVERVGPGGYGWTVARHRFFDDCLRSSVEDGIEQLVILGAGYDARAYRLDQIVSRVKVFEVDHPATQKEKMQKLGKILGTLPDHVVYVSVDFEREKLEERLFSSGYENTLKTLFIWEAVTMYLSPEAVDHTLSFIAQHSAAGSCLAFDYIHQSVVDGTCQLLGAGQFKKACERRGDGLHFGLKEGNVESFLLQRGFCQISTETGYSLKEKYFRGAHEKYGVAPFIGYVHATIKPK